MAITAQMVKELREKTGAGMMDCKKALAESNGDLAKATDWLRTKGIASADKKSSRTAVEGVVEHYIHKIDGVGRVGVLIEVNIETDFAAKNENFQALARDLAMQIAAMNPGWVSAEDIPEDVLERERTIAREQALNDGKPEAIIDRIVEGRLKKFYADNCLMNQQFIKDDSKTVETMVKEMIGSIGENIKVRRFVRFEVGEGLEKKEENFAEEVAKQIK